MPEFRRKRNRLLRPVYIGRQSHFITSCAEGRQKILTEPHLALSLIDLLRTIAAEQVFKVYAYCVMPDHLHIEVYGTHDSCDLAQFVRVFKGRATPIARRLGFPEPWQKGYFDHVLRPGESLDAVAWYIFQNPVRAGLVSDARNWPYSGSFEFDWLKFVRPLEEFVPPWKKKL